MELILDGIQKKFDNKEVLKGASFSFEKGKIYGLLGRNGAGKTTLFNCISGEIMQDGGTIMERGAEGEKPFAYEKIGYAFATPVLPEFLTGYEFIKFYLDINKKVVGERKSVEEYADMVQLEHSDLDRLVKGYSFGMKNKLQMLCLMITKPPVILLDEPLTSLDVVAAHEMKEMLKGMKEDHIIILSTHIMQLAKDLCDDIVLLHEGVLEKVEAGHDETEDEFEKRIMNVLMTSSEIAAEQEMK